MTPLPETWGTATSVVVLVLGSVVLIVCGTRFTGLVDRLADRLGIGEALTGALLLGSTTSIPGLIVTGVAAHHGNAELAVANALGGIAAQTMFLALADLTYRHSNLEHAAASLPNLLQAMLLVALVAVVLLATSGPPLEVAGIHPATLVLPVVYGFGLRLVSRARTAPMWRPLHTAATRLDVEDPDEASRPARSLVLPLLAMGTIVAGCGYAIAAAGIALSETTGLSGTVVGATLTGVVTSLPELVTVLAAVRAGALTLAVGDIIGGNCFDVLFLAVADVALAEGSIYAHIGGRSLFLLSLTLLLTAFLAAGLLTRDRSGIGFEGVAILATYLGGMWVLTLIP